MVVRLRGNKNDVVWVLVEKGPGDKRDGDWNYFLNREFFFI